MSEGWKIVSVIAAVIVFLAFSAFGDKQTELDIEERKKRTRSRKDLPDDDEE